MPFLPVVSGVDCYTAVRHTVCQYWTAITAGRPSGKNFIIGHMYRLVIFDNAGLCVPGGGGTPLIWAI